MKYFLILFIVASASKRTCKSCNDTQNLCDVANKAPSQKLKRNNSKRIRDLCEDKYKLCEKSKQYRNSLNLEVLQLDCPNTNDELYKQKVDKVFDSVGCEGYISLDDRLKKLEQKVNELQKAEDRRPTVASIAKYDIVYTFIQDLKSLTGNKSVRIENIKDPNFLKNSKDSKTTEALLDKIKKRFGPSNSRNEESDCGIDNFLKITNNISFDHGCTAHLTPKEKMEEYDYDKLKDLCQDNDLIKVLDLVREYGSSKNFPLHRPKKTWIVTKNKF